MRSGQRLGMVAVAATLLMLTLAGCTASDDISARLESGNLVFVVCQKQEYTRLRVLTAEKDVKPVELVDRWVADGDASETHSGSKFVYGTVPDGAATELGPEVLGLEGRVVQFYLESIEDGSAETGAFGQFDGDLLESDKWLNTIRGLSDTPCQ